MKVTCAEEYKVFQRKVIGRFVLMALIAMGLVFLFYYLLWYRRGGDSVVYILECLGMERERAIVLYDLIFRVNKEAFFTVAILLVFIVLVRSLLVWLLRYLDNINSGIDKLLTEDNQEIHLLPEMKPMEMKLNVVKQTLWQRKQEALHAEQRKNELVMYLAHDIRTPLTSVIGYLNLLEETSDMLPEQKAKYIHISLEKAYRLERMVNEFFEMTRYNSGEVRMKMKTIDLYYMLVQVIDEHVPSLTAHGNYVTLKAGENMTVFGDPEELARVFHNLLKNAAAYSNPGTEIQVTAKEAGEEVTIFFENRGKTIPPEQLESMFRKFLRLDEARKSTTGGTGLGLAIAKEIVCLHGGTIEAQSQNNTVTFIVTLPVTCERKKRKS